MPLQFAFIPFLDILGFGILLLKYVRNPIFPSIQPNVCDVVVSTIGQAGMSECFHFLPLRCQKQSDSMYQELQNQGRCYASNGNESS